MELILNLFLESSFVEISLQMNTVLRKSKAID